MKDIRMKSLKPGQLPRREILRVRKQATIQAFIRTDNMKQGNMETIGGKGMISRDKGNFARLPRRDASEKETNESAQAIVGRGGKAPRLDTPLPNTNNSGRYA